MAHVINVNTEPVGLTVVLIRAVDGDIRMLHDRVLCDPCATPFAPPSHHQSADVGHVGHVTWPDYAAPHYDMAHAACVYSGRCDGASWSDVTAAAAHCAYVAPAAGYTGCSSTSSLWRCATDDRLVTLPAACGSSALAPPPTRHRVQLHDARCSPSTGDVVHHGWQLARPSTDTEMSTCSYQWRGGRAGVLTFSDQSARHQLSQQPVCTVSSSSHFTTVDDDDDDHNKHQFGTRPTRASTSIGNLASALQHSIRVTSHTVTSFKPSFM